MEIKTQPRFGMKPFGGEMSIKKRVMFHKKKRIDKKWRKNDEYYIWKKVGFASNILITTAV